MTKPPNITWDGAVKLWTQHRTLEPKAGAEPELIEYLERALRLISPDHIWDGLWRYEVDKQGFRENFVGTQEFADQFAWEQTSMLPGVRTMREHYDKQRKGLPDTPKARSRFVTDMEYHYCWAAITTLENVFKQPDNQRERMYYVLALYLKLKEKRGVQNGR